MITTKGRLLGDFRLEFEQGEIQISCIRLEKDEHVAILIDRLKNQARIYGPLEECQRLALRHQYELVMHTQEEESFVSRIERFVTRTTTDSAE